MTKYIYTYTDVHTSTHHLATTMSELQSENKGDTVHDERHAAVDEKHQTANAPEHDGVLGINQDALAVEGVHTAGMAVIEQIQVIPKTGKRIPTGRWEYWTFVLYCE